MSAGENGHYRPRDYSFDELAKGLASGTISRRKALRLMGSALLGGVLASIPGVALAQQDGNSACAHFCNEVFPPGPERGQCKSQGAKGEGPCYECTPGLGGGPNFPGCPADQVPDEVTCECICPSGTIGSGTISPCQSGDNPELNACCPPEGFIACCGGFIQDYTTPTLPVVGEYIGCINDSCPGGCVIMATDPGDLLGSNAGRCITESECTLCGTDSGGIGCLRDNPDGTVQCDPL
jgi:hypothetical protein